jgi:esterase/lipase
VEAIQAPSASGLLGEVRGLLEIPRLVTRAPRLSRQPRGEGEAVLVLPGYGAGDASTSILRTYLRLLGYRARGWGLGRNRGDVEALLPRVADRVDRISRSEGGPVALIGWSLGGVLAREAARECPRAVRQVITLGSPVVGGPKYTAVAEVYRRRGVDLDEIEARVAERNREPLQSPVTAIYSRSDGVVAWRACIDPYPNDVEHVEVETSHLGLGFSTEVYEIIARHLSSRRKS